MHFYHPHKLKWMQCLHFLQLKIVTIAELLKKLQKLQGKNNVL